jgi:hypothetical protein
MVGLVGWVQKGSTRWTQHTCLYIRMSWSLNTVDSFLKQRGVGRRVLQRGSGEHT